MRSLRPGFVLADRYRLLRVLGSGGSSVVWAAAHVVTRHEVALKVLTNRDDAYKARFLREARIAARLAHPNVVPVHDVFALEDDALVMVMDLLEGMSLATWIRTQGPLSARQTAHVAMAVASALTAASSEGAVHRDLKPENIFLTGTSISADSIRVLDFGVAKWKPMAEDETCSSTLTTTGALVGTPHYMAPEQVFGEKDVDMRADVWALGAVLFECLSGQRAFGGDNYGQVFKGITVDSLPRLNASLEVPALLAGLVTQLLSRDRSERPSLESVLVTCEALLGEGEGATSVKTIPAMLPKPSRAREWTAGVALSLAAVVGAVVMTHGAKTKDRPTEANAASTPVVAMTFDAGESPAMRAEGALVSAIAPPDAVAGGDAGTPATTAPALRPKPAPRTSETHLPGRVHPASPY